LNKLRLVYSERRSRLEEDERGGERKRIARELHDTLLQGLQGILLEIQMFSRTSTLTEEQHERAARIEQKLRHVVTDGRDAINALRSAGDARDWVAIILDMGDRLSQESEISFSMQVHGEPWNLHPKVRDEVLAIVREGLRNAFVHSHARVIHVAINYAKHGLRIAIQDNGIGVSEQHVQLRQKEGHWGIAGMRERSEKLSGRLTIESQLSMGTAVNLVIPRHFTFEVARELSSRLSGTEL
jgi:signal transduction histidine kinase